MRDIKSLREVSFSDSNFDDAALEHLRDHIEIEILYADGTQVTGRGFQGFSPTSKLGRVSVFGCPITRTGLDAIVSLSQLKHLGLSNVGAATDLDLLGVNWPALETLDLFNIPITNDIVKELAQIETLTWLRINETKLANVDLSPINSLRNLEDLHLDCTGVTAAQVNQLVELVKLDELALADNGIKPQDLAPLKAALPDCDIWCDM